jgi:hypothetical protein
MEIRYVALSFLCFRESHPGFGGSDYARTIVIHTENFAGIRRRSGLPPRLPRPMLLRQLALSPDQPDVDCRSTGLVKRIRCRPMRAFRFRWGDTWQPAGARQRFSWVLSLFLLCKDTPQSLTRESFRPKTLLETVQRADSGTEF